MNTQQVAQNVAQGSSMRHNTPRTDAATYPADCLGKTLVVHRDCAAALEIELKEAEQIDNASNHYMSRAESAEAECLEQARLLGMSGNQIVALQRPLLHLTSLWHQLFFLLDITEESDSGNEFRPNYITSCRAVDGERIQKILEEAKQLINANVKNEHSVRDNLQP